MIRHKLLLCLLAAISGFGGKHKYGASANGGSNGGFSGWLKGLGSHCGGFLNGIVQTGNKLTQEELDFIANIRDTSSLSRNGEFHFFQLWSIFRACF